MRRKLAALLAALLLLGCMTSALGAEGAAPAAEGRTAFEEFGPWHNWTQAQKDEAANWAEAQWERYWSEYESWIWTLEEQYDSDYDAWHMEYYGRDRETYWEEYIRERKEALGLPYPDGINISLNGTYLSFGEERPLALSNRTMVPFRAFLEALDARVSYEGGHITATLPGGETLEMDLDSTALTVTRDGQMDVLEMDVTPYVRSARTYIPVRFAAEALGLEVVWDEEFQIAHLTDWAALRAELDGQLTAFNAIMAANAAAVDLSQTYANQSSVSVSGTLYGENKNDTAALALSGSGLVSAKGMSGDYRLSIDLGGLRDTLFSALPEEAVSLLEELSGSTYSVIVNAGEGAVYFKGSDMELLSGGQIPNDAWAGLRTAAEDPALLGFCLGGGAPGTLGELLARSPTYYYGGYSAQSPYEQVMAQAKPYLLLLGDENFTTSGSGENKRYTMSLTMDGLLERGLEMELLDEYAAHMLRQQVGGFTWKCTAQVTGGKLADLSFQGSVKLKGVLPVELGFTASGTPAKMTGCVEVKGTYIGKIAMQMERSAAVSAKQVPAAPPAGETVRDLEVLLGYREPGVPASFGAGRYVSGILDARYRGAYDAEWLTAMDMTKSEAVADRQADLAQAAEYFALFNGVYDLTDAQQEELTGLMRELFNKADYQVGKPVSDGVDYAVEVTAVPLAFADAFNATYLAAVEAVEQKYAQMEDTEEAYAAYFGELYAALAESFRGALDAAAYGEAQTATLSVSARVDGSLSVDRWALSNLDEALFPGLYG